MSDGTSGDEGVAESGSIGFAAREVAIVAVHTERGPMVRVDLPEIGIIIMPHGDAVVFATAMVEAATTCAEYLAAEAASRPTTLNS